MTVSRFPWAATQVQGERCLADAAFLVEERDDHRCSSFPAFPRPSAPPTTEELDYLLDFKLGGAEAFDWLDENAVFWFLIARGCGS